MQTSPILLEARVETKRLWRKACIAEGIAPDSLFVVFSQKHAALNTATTKFLVLTAIQTTFELVENDLFRSDLCSLKTFRSLQHAYNAAMKEAF